MGECYIGYPAYEGSLVMFTYSTWIAQGPSCWAFDGGYTPGVYDPKVPWKLKSKFKWNRKKEFYDPATITVVRENYENSTGNWVERIEAGLLKHLSESEKQVIPENARELSVRCRNPEMFWARWCTRGEAASKQAREKLRICILILAYRLIIIRRGLSGHPCANMRLLLAAFVMSLIV